jgi:G-patch domain
MVIQLMVAHLPGARPPHRTHLAWLNLTTNNRTIQVMRIVQLKMNSYQALASLEFSGVFLSLPYHCSCFNSQKLLRVSNSLNGGRKVEKPLVIPALKNKDWRELARKRRNGIQYVPPSAMAVTGKDGSIGGLGTKDTINSGPVLSGLQVKQKAISVVEGVNVVEDVQDVGMEIEEETEDQKALRAILAETNGETHIDPVIDIIPTLISESDALKQDVDELPDAATLEDYARVPVSQFGAALLRGMGWKEGTSASRKPGKGLIEPYIPSARPALLGIGAKEQEVYDDGSKKGGKSKRPDRRYVPIIKQERSDTPSNGTRDRSRSPRRNGSGRTSRHSSRSPSRYNSRSERRYDTEGQDRDRERRRDRRHDDERDRSDRKRDRSRESSRRK